ncbi:Clavaminate synthase-like protein [Meredithblackwellia eburnea MCA 4105]
MVAAPETISSDSDSGIPLLSYAEAVDPALRDDFLAKLSHALLHVGFFQLTHIDQVITHWQSDYDHAFGTSASFFALPQHDKDQIEMKRNRHFRGYSRVGEETTAGKKDLREQIDLAPDTPTQAPYPPNLDSTPIELSLYGPNQYPSQIPEFQTAINRHRANCELISHSLIQLIGESLSPTPKVFTSIFDPPDEGKPCYSRMKVVHYPAAEKGKEGLGVGPHKDGGGLTLLAQGLEGGLQVQRWDGKWEDVKPIKYALVINVGQVIELLSASLYPATTHRVVPPRTSRLSIPYFHCPPLTSTVTPIPTSSLHPHLILHEKVKETSEVTKGDLHENVFGRTAWRGVTRSHEVTWEKFYSKWDTLGGPVKIL